MKKYIALSVVILICGCTHLPRQEHSELQQLKSQGITVEHSNDFEAPANPGVAGAMNLLPVSEIFISLRATAPTALIGCTAF